MIWGTGPTVFHLAVGVLRSGFVGGANPEIVLCGEDAEDNLRTLEELEPWMSSKVRITIGSSRPECWRGARLAFVCEEGEAEGIGTASTLRRWISEAAPILVAVPDADAATALRAAGVGLDNTSLISISESLYGRRWLTDWAFDELARARHELYRRNELEKGVTLEENSSLLQWGELPEEKKAANRDFARRAASVLNDVGAELAPLSGRETGDLLLDESQIERMAIAEHDGWVADRERRGWKYGPVRDEETEGASDDDSLGRARS